MPPRRQAKGAEPVLLVRHAQSEWNLRFGPARIDPGIPDPDLTAEGVRQAEAMIGPLRAHGIRRLISSPYRRALQTACIVAEALDLPIAVDPVVRERCAYSCDEGSSPGLLARDWPHLDFSGLEETWWGGMTESHDSLAARCVAFRAGIAALADRHEVAVVTHWGFIRCLTGQEVGNSVMVRLA